MPLAGAPGIGPIIGALTGSEQFKSLAGEVRWKADPEMMKKFELFTSGILSRPISEINKFMTLPAGSTALRMMTGTKIYEKDLPEMQLQKFKEYAARLNELFSARLQKEKFMVRE